MTSQDIKTEPEFCPYCDGSGESTSRSGGGPDAWDEPCTCPRCKGAQTLRAAYDTLAEELPSLQLKVAQLGIFHSHATRYGWAPNQTDGMQSFAKLAAQWLAENATPQVSPLQARVPLTEGQIDDVLKDVLGITWLDKESRETAACIARVIERAHLIGLETKEGGQS